MYLHNQGQTFSIIPMRGGNGPGLLLGDRFVGYRSLDKVQLRSLAQKIQTFLDISATGEQLKKLGTKTAMKRYLDAVVQEYRVKGGSDL